MCPRKVHLQSTVRKYYSIMIQMLNKPVFRNTFVASSASIDFCGIVFIDELKNFQNKL